MKIEIPDRAMSFQAARSALGLKVLEVSGNIIKLSVKGQELQTELKQSPLGDKFVTLSINGQWRDVYIDVV